MMNRKQRRAFDRNKDKCIEKKAMDGIIERFFIAVTEKTIATPDGISHDDYMAIYGDFETEWQKTSKKSIAGYREAFFRESFKDAYFGIKTGEMTTEEAFDKCVDRYNIITGYKQKPFVREKTATISKRERAKLKRQEKKNG